MKPTDAATPIETSERLFRLAEDTLLAPNDLDGSRLAPVFGRLLTHDLDYADLYFQYSRSEAWTLEEGQVKSGSFNIDQGVGVRAVSGEKTAFAYSDEISLDALSEAAEATRAIARSGGGKTYALAKRGGGARCINPSIRWQALRMRRKSVCWKNWSRSRANSIRA